MISGFGSTVPVDSHFSLIITGNVDIFLDICCCSRQDWSLFSLFLLFYFWIHESKQIGCEFGGWTQPSSACWFTPHFAHNCKLAESCHVCSMDLPTTRNGCGGFVVVILIFLTRGATNQWQRHKGINWTKSSNSSCCSWLLYMMSTCWINTSIHFYIYRFTPEKIISKRWDIYLYTSTCRLCMLNLHEDIKLLWMHSLALTLTHWRIFRAIQ